MAAPSSDTLRIALVGNPNSGKTTVFNGLTGSRQKVANYPGVTVEKREARMTLPGGGSALVLDLPGTYSLSAHSEDERVACQAVLTEKPDVVIAVLDASNLVRNLYLVVQLMELGARMVIALNMVDAARAQGRPVDARGLEKALGLPVIETVGTERLGLDELVKKAVEAAGKPAPAPMKVAYDAHVAEAAGVLALRIASLLGEEGAAAGKGCGLSRPPLRWLALQLLGRDEATIARISETASPELASKLLDDCVLAIEKIEASTGKDIDLLLVEPRYRECERIGAAGLGALRVGASGGAPSQLTEKIDAVLTHRLWGLPIFLLIMFTIFQLTFKLGEVPMGWIEAAFGWMGDKVTALMPEGMLQRAVKEAVFDGVAGVLVFVPQILIMFFFIGLLEDSGYLARAAFLIDRVMRRFGLHGKSLIPMLLGFGCNIPAIMAARTLDNRRDRLLTIIVTPMMNCQARLVVHVLLAGTFFREAHRGYALFGIYLIGIGLALLSAVLMRKLLFGGEASPFLLEMPSYRRPSLHTTLVQMRDRALSYVKKAGTVLLAFSVLVWLGCNFPRPTPDAAGNLPSKSEQLRTSYAGRFGETLAPLMKPLGLDSWQMSIALVAGTVAKEVIVATLGTVYGAEAEDDDTALREQLVADPKLNPLRAFALMVFVLLYVPCITTMAIMKRETNTWRWPIFVVVYTTALAWGLALLIYQGGKLLGLGT